MTTRALLEAVIAQLIDKLDIELETGCWRRGAYERFVAETPAGKNLRKASTFFLTQVSWICRLGGLPEDLAPYFSYQTRHYGNTHRHNPLAPWLSEESAHFADGVLKKMLYYHAALTQPAAVEPEEWESAVFIPPCLDLTILWQTTKRILQALQSNWEKLSADPDNLVLQAAICQDIIRLGELGTLNDEYRGLRNQIVHPETIPGFPGLEGVDSPAAILNFFMQHVEATGLPQQIDHHLSLCQRLLRPDEEATDQDDNEDDSHCQTYYASMRASLLAITESFREDVSNTNYQKVYDDLFAEINDNFPASYAEFLRDSKEVYGDDLGGKSWRETIHKELNAFHESIKEMVLSCIREIIAPSEEALSLVSKFLSLYDREFTLKCCLELFFYGLPPKQWGDLFQQGLILDIQLIIMFLVVVKTKTHRSDDDADEFMKISLHYIQQHEPRRFEAIYQGCIQWFAENSKKNSEVSLLRVFNTFIACADKFDPAIHNRARIRINETGDFLPPFMYLLFYRRVAYCKSLIENADGFVLDTPFPEALAKQFNGLSLGFLLADIYRHFSPLDEDYLIQGRDLREQCRPFFNPDLFFAMLDKKKMALTRVLPLLSEPQQPRRPYSLLAILIRAFDFDKTCIRYPTREEREAILPQVLSMMERLIAAGAPLNDVEDTLNRPFLFACRVGDIRPVRLLFEAAKKMKTPEVLERMLMPIACCGAVPEQEFLPRIASCNGKDYDRKSAGYENLYSKRYQKQLKKVIKAAEQCIARLAENRFNLHTAYNKKLVLLEEQVQNSDDDKRENQSMIIQRIKMHISRDLAPLHLWINNIRAQLQKDHLFPGQRKELIEQLGILQYRKEAFGSFAALHRWIEDCKVLLGSEETVLTTQQDTLFRDLVDSNCPQALNGWFKVLRKGLKGIEYDPYRLNAHFEKLVELKNRLCPFSVRHEAILNEIVFLEKPAEGRKKKQTGKLRRLNKQRWAMLEALAAGELPLAGNAAAAAAVTTTVTTTTTAYSKILH